MGREGEGERERQHDGRAASTDVIDKTSNGARRRREERGERREGPRPYLPHGLCPSVCACVRAQVVSGTVSSDEFATRSSIGKYYYPCLGENEKVSHESIC